MDIKTLQDILNTELRLRNEHIVERLRNGETMQTVADDLGLTRQRIQAIAKRAGFSRRMEKAEQVAQ